MGKELCFNENDLRRLPLFSELNDKQLKKISSVSILKIFQKKNIIFNEGDTYKGFYIILTGTVKIYKTSAEGKEILLHIIKPVNTFADVPLFEGGNYPVTAETLSDSTLLFVPKQEFTQLLEENIIICLKMLGGFAKKLRSLTQKIEDLTLRDVPSRLAEYLIIEANLNGTAYFPEPLVKLTIPKSLLALQLGTINETLSRAFKKLQNDEIIRVNGKKIFISNFQRLKRLVK